MREQADTAAESALPPFDWGLLIRSAFVVVCFGAIAVLPVFAIAHPALVIPLAAAPLGVILMMRIPVWLVLGFVAFSFFRLHEAFPVLLPFRIPQLLALPTLMVLVWHIGVKRSIAPFWGPQLTAFAVFFSLVTLGLPFASNPGIAMEAWTSSYVKIGIMTLSIAWLVRKPFDFLLAQIVIVASGTAVAIIAISNKLAGIGLVEGTRVTIGRDIGSVLGDPNDLSLVLTFPLSFAVAMATTKGGGVKRIMAGLAAGAIIWGIVSTQSRGGLLGIVAVFGVVGVQLIKSKLVLGMIGTVGLAGLFAVAGISDRSSGGAAEDGIDESAMGRIWAWTAAFNMAMARPLNGVGLDNFIPNFWKYTPHWTGFNKAVHSTWLGVLAETGWPGLIAFVSMVIITARVAYVATRTLKQSDAPFAVRATSFALLAGIAGFCTSGTFLTQGFTWPFYILLSLTSAVSNYAKPFAKGEAQKRETPQIRLSNRVSRLKTTGTAHANRQQNLDQAQAEG